MPAGNRAFRYLQVGKQGNVGALGSSVAASAILKPDAGTLKLTQNLQFHEQELEVAHLAAYHGSELLAQGPYDVTYNADATYQQILYLLEGIIEPATITTPTNGVLTRLWTYDPPWTSAPGQRVYTLEFGDDLIAYTIDTCYLESMQMTLGLAAPVKVSSTFKGFNRTEEAKTAALTVPTTETMISGMATLYMEDTGAAISGAAPTEIADVLIDGQLTINSGLKAERRLNGDLGLAVIAQDRRQMIEFTGTAELNSDSDAWAGLLDANTKKFFKLQVQGSLIESVTPDYFQKFEVMWCGRFRSFDPFGELAGINTVPFSTNSEFDSTWGKEALVRVQTTVTTLP
jgi:hypothetical protein